MKCSKCGYENNDTSKFCVNCGTDLHVIARFEMDQNSVLTNINANNNLNNTNIEDNNFNSAILNNDNSLNDNISNGELENINNKSIIENTSDNQNVIKQSQIISQTTLNDNVKIQQPIQNVNFESQSLNNENNGTIYTNKGNENAKINKKEKLGTISMIIGIISIVLSIFLNILILPLAIIGLVLGIINKVKKGKKFSGIILNTVAIVIPIIILIVTILCSDQLNEFLNILYNEMDYVSSENYVAGKYDCTGVDSNTDKYLITLHLNNDGTFLYGPYGNMDNNYAKGTYTFEDENKTNGNGSYRYFMVTFTGPKEDFIQNGVASDHDFQSEMEIGLTSENGKKQGVIMFTNSYNMYYCYEK